MIVPLTHHKVLFSVTIAHILDIDANNFADDPLMAVGVVSELLSITVLMDVQVCVLVVFNCANMTDPDI